MEERSMAVGIRMDFPGGTQEQYDRMMEQLNLGERMPPGGILHTSGWMPEGWLVVEVWESQEAFDTFFEERLSPVMRNVRLPLPRVYRTYDLYHSLGPAVP
jgi:hypothetical protein